MSTITIPEVKEILTTGMQFGHSTSRWNPKMAKYIYTSKNKIHVVDVIKSRDLLAKAAAFIQEAASRGPIVFVGSKRQISQLVQKYAIEAGAYFVVNRWPGGLLTNNKLANKSFRRLLELEKMFEEGIEGRTKFEISRLKVDWQRLARLYSGIKTMESLPTAVVIVDPRYEKVAVKEARKAHVPIVALTDTNCDPDVVDYIVPGNDDALGAVELFLKVIAEASKLGNAGKGIVHNLKDYTQVEVKILKAEDNSEKESTEVETTSAGETHDVKKVIHKPLVKKAKKGEDSRGILEKAKERGATTKTKLKS